MTADTPCAARLPSGILVRMRHVAREREHVAGREIEAIARDEDRDLAGEAREELARAGQMRRAAHRSAGRELHDVEQLVRHALRDQRAHRDAAAAALTRELGTRPLAHLRARRRQQLVERHAQRAGDFDQHRQRRVAAARFEIGDRRARHAGRFRQRALREIAHVPERNEVAREMGGDELGAIHKLQCVGSNVRGSDIPPLRGHGGWFAGDRLYLVYRSAFAHRRAQMQTDMQSTRVLITGGTSGLGLALVRELTRRGAQRRVRRADGRARCGRRARVRRSRHRRRHRAEARHPSNRVASDRRARRPGRAGQQRLRSRADAARTARRYAVRGLRARARDECARAVPTDEGVARFAGCVCSRGSRQRRAEHFERRGGERVRALGRIRRQQSCACSHDAHLERGDVVAGCEAARARSRRHGHADACVWPCRMPTARR